jgi:hypothetical protein
MMKKRELEKKGVGKIGRIRKETRRAGRGGAGKRFMTRKRELEN